MQKSSKLLASDVNDLTEVEREGEKMLKQFFTRVFSLNASTQQIQFPLMPLAKKAQ